MFKQTMLDFNIKLPVCGVKLLKEQSNCVVSYLQLVEYGDWFIFGDNSIIKQTYDECCNCFTYSLGKFDNGVYKSVISWTISEDIFEGTKIL